MYYIEVYRRPSDETFKRKTTVKTNRRLMLNSDTYFVRVDQSASQFIRFYYSGI